MLSKNLGPNVGRIHFQLRTRKLCRVTDRLTNPPRVCTMCNTPEVYLLYPRLIKYGGGNTGAHYSLNFLKVRGKY